MPNGPVIFVEGGLHSERKCKGIVQGSMELRIDYCQAGVPLDLLWSRTQGCFRRVSRALHLVYK